MFLWRLVKSRHTGSAFDGEDARLFGGRWNARGTPAVYLSESLSLAALELVVHLNAEDTRLRFAAVAVEVPDNTIVHEMDAGDLPDDWRVEPPPDGCKALGSNWLDDGGAVLLKLPSAIVPREFNYLLNPRHPDFARLRIHEPEPFGFDERMRK